jgi:hypothetical protein
VQATAIVNSLVLMYLTPCGVARLFGQIPDATTDAQQVAHLQCRCSMTAMGAPVSESQCRVVASRLHCSNRAYVEIAQLSSESLAQIDERLFARAISLFCYKGIATGAGLIDLIAGTSVLK